MAYDNDYRPNVMPVFRHPQNRKLSTDDIASKELENEATPSDVPKTVDQGGLPQEKEVSQSDEPETKGYVFEDRPGGGDIRRAPPKPVLQHDGAEYAAVTMGATRRTYEFDEEEMGEIHKSPASGVLTFLGWCVCTFVVLWMFTAASPFLANALTLQGARFWVSLVLGFIPLSFVLFLMVYVLVRFRKIPGVEQVNATSFSNKMELRRRLMDLYLDRIRDVDRYAAENGFADGGDGGSGYSIAHCLKRLKGENGQQIPDTRAWLIEFERFQQMQDERAGEIVSRAWQLVAIKTAASPWKIVDMAAVIYNSTIMVMRLARVYNRRTSRRAAFRLVCRWFVNIYIAGEMGDATQGAVEWASANDLISATYKPLAGFVGKIAEGGANAFLVYRLGRRAMAYFRPLVETVA